MSVIITRLFDTYEHASQAVNDLEAGGIPHAHISLVANNTDDRHSGSVAGTGNADAPANGAGTGASLGTLVGGGAGLLTGLGLLAIPGVGPVVAAGWLVATAVGAGLGAASGGIIGSLVGAGVSETDAHVYAEGVRRGGTLVTVRADEGQGAMVERTLDARGPVDTAARGASYRAEGWKGFDEKAPAYSAGATPGLGVPGSSSSTTVPVTPARGMPII